MFISTLYYAFNAVIPILLLILIGYMAKKRGMLNDIFLKTANKFNFRFALSALMFMNIYQLDGINDIPAAASVYVIAVLILLTLAGIAAVHIFKIENRRKGVLVQAFFRSNYAVIGIPVATALTGSAGAAMASALQAPTIIYYNFISIICMSIYAENAQHVDVKKVMKDILQNPLIIGLVAGVAVLAVRQGIPIGEDGEKLFTIKNNLPWLYTLISYLSRMATPMALIVLGGQFDFKAIKNRKKELWIGLTGRLIGAPVLALLMAFILSRCHILEINAVMVSVIIAIFGSPMAVNSIVMAAEMDGDDVLAGQLVVWSSFIGMATMFILVVLMRLIGIL